MNKDQLKDISGKHLELGHIVAVRYVWNSYVGEITLRGLCATGAFRHAFFSPHKLELWATYQVLSHTDKAHEDFNADATNWYQSENGDSPVKIKIYENMK